MIGQISARCRSATSFEPASNQIASWNLVFTAPTSLSGGQPNFARCFAISWAGTIYSYIHFWGSYPWRNYGRCKIHFASMSCILLYWQRCSTVLEQRASAKLCGMVQGMELRNFRRGRHLYSARAYPHSTWLWINTTLRQQHRLVLKCAYFWI